MEARDSLGFGFKTTMATAQTTKPANTAKEPVEKRHNTAKSSNADNTAMEPHFTIFVDIWNLGFFWWIPSC